MAGVGVLIGVEVVVVVLVVLVFTVPALFVFSLAQPIPKEATASKAKSAKVLRIEFVSYYPEGSDCWELSRNVALMF